jgi:hypothetical protein
MKFKELRGKLREASELSKNTIPAPMLVLRRQGIRVFPDGRHVALYTNDKYNLMFTVPFGVSAVSGTAPESIPVLTGQPNA